MVEEGLMGSKGQCPSCGHKFVLRVEHQQPPQTDDLGTAPTIQIIRDEPFDFDLGENGPRWAGSNSYLAALAGALLFLIVAAVTFWAGRLESVPAWMQWPASLHAPFGHGALALLIAALGMEALGRLERFEHVRAALPFLLMMTVVVLFGADISGACTGASFGAHTAMAQVATAMGILALVLALHAGERPESDRTLLLVVITLGVGALLLTAYWGRRL